MANSLWETEDYARRYDEIVRGPYPFHKRAAARLVEFAAPRPDQDVLDLGAGTGLVAEEILRYRPLWLTLADSSWRMLAIAEKQFEQQGYLPASNVQFACADADWLTNVLRDESRDLVIASYAFGWFPDPSTVFRQVAAVLRAGGLLVFDVPPPAEPEPVFLATTPVFQVFSREFGRLLREQLSYAPVQRRRRALPPDFAEYVSMAQAAGFEVVEMLRVDVPYSVDDVEAAWRYGWWFSAAANPALARLDPDLVEIVADDAIALTRRSDEYAAWRSSGAPLWETYAALKVRKA